MPLNYATQICEVDALMTPSPKSFSWEYAMSTKKALPLAVFAASAFPVSPVYAAMHLSDQGIGETLIFPFYSVESGNNTLVNVANATEGHKAVKVRILEGRGSQEVLDFNLYLSPKDHFSFSISATGTGGAKLSTADRSCTVPTIPADGVEFLTTKIGGDVSRTRTGYVEVIEMGQLDPKSAPIIDTKALADPTIVAMNAADAITHNADGIPANCRILVDAWSRYSGVDGVWFAESKTTDLTGGSEFLANWAGGGLYGYATVINVPEGASFGFDAIAIADHVAAGATGSDMHYYPADVRPNLADSAMDTAAIVSVDGRAVTLDFDGDYTSELIERTQAVNALIMATEVYNDYVTDPAISARTDWVMTFPTKSFHVDGGTPFEPFDGGCEPIAMGAFDREEMVGEGWDDSSTPGFSPTPPGPGAPNLDIPLCDESTIVQFGAESATGVGRAVGVSDFLPSKDGWAIISMLPATISSTLGVCTDGQNFTNPCKRSIDAGDGQLVGLPVIGFAVQKYVNGSAGGTGILANYATAVAHKSCAAGSGTAYELC